MTFHECREQFTFNKVVEGDTMDVKIDLVTAASEQVTVCCRTFAPLEACNSEPMEVI